MRKASYLLFFSLMVFLLIVCENGTSIQEKIPDPTTSKPNILFIMADDLGYNDLGCYGQKLIQTPYIDRLAEEGMKFTQCYAGSPVCAPSRSVLMTGQHTGHTTVRGNFGKGGVMGLGGRPGRVPLHDEDITVAEVLKTAGYVTGMTGKWGLGEPNTTGEPNRQGFDEFFGFLNQRRAHSYYVPYLWRDTSKVVLEKNENEARGTYVHDLFTEFAIDFIDRHQDTSFFLYLPYTIPHSRLEVPELGTYTDSTHWTENEQIFAAMVTRMDTDVGRIMELLKRLQIDQNTIVFFCSDNGAAEFWKGRFNSSGPLRGRKRDLYEGGIRTPMIVRYPGKIPAGTTNDFPWHFADVLPTLASITGAKAPAEIDGIDVSAEFRMGDTNWERPERQLYWEFYERGMQQAVRMDKWKGIRLELNGEWELYDLSADQAETINIASKHPEIVEKIAAFANTEHVPSPHYFPEGVLSD